MSRTPADPNDPYPEPPSQAPKQPWAEDRKYDWDDHLADCVDLDEADAEDWAEMACSMGRDGQCGQAGSEWCDFECPIMRRTRTTK
jgi:hypothetical protein